MTGAARTTRWPVVLAALAVLAALPLVLPLLRLAPETAAADDDARVHVDGTAAANAEDPFAGKVDATESTLSDAVADATSVALDASVDDADGSVDEDAGPTYDPGPSPQAAAERLRQRVLEWTGEDYLAASAGAIDGEAAYAAYGYALSCVDGITSESQFLLRQRQYQRYFDAGEVTDPDTSARIKRRMQRVMEDLEDSLVHCGGLGDDVVGLAADWLLLAVDLDYLPALVSFHQDLPELLSRRNHGAFRRPELVEIYALRAEETLQEAIASGHPDAFRAYAAALRRGLAVDADPVRAHAMLLMAEAIDAGGTLTGRTDPALGPAANDEALILAEALCQQYCP